MEIIFRSLCVVGVTFIGVLITLTDRQQIFTDVKWTDIGGLLVTFFGFLFGFHTYFQWLNGKRKEDAYLSAKRYVASIEEIEEHLHELDYQYFHICPAAGTIVESNDISLKRVEHLHSVLEYLYIARRNMHKCHRELTFWNVRLIDEFDGRHKDINKVLDNISVVSSALNSQLSIFVKNDMSNMNEVINQKKRFDELYDNYKSHTSHRMGRGFKSMYLFREK